MTKIQKIEERISKRKERINKYQEKLKEEKNLLKKDEEILTHIKYEDVIKALVKNKVDPQDIMQMVNDVVAEDEEQKESSENSFKQN
ncbi:hypothetical protein [Sporosarcina sp. BP05]|uniref:hypothetical protein n=1 Tax=Sporosarcina sp. BP05 TaxID=2758726 RepID=UPI001648A602|nr:hypothetical protein [Sporosarcina sp. BP05]